MKKMSQNHCSVWLQLLFFAFVTILSIAFTVEAQPAKAGQSTVIVKLTPKEGYELIQKNKNNPNFVILDIRTPEEFESGYIEGAININYHSDTFVEDLDKLDKNKTYFVYCRTGRRSSDAADIMTKQGFKEIYRINGDIVKWKSEGLPVAKVKR